MIDRCFLCDRQLEPSEVAGTQLHPEVDDCQVRITDSYGISVDDELPDEWATRPQLASSLSVSGDSDLLIKQFVPVDVALGLIFEARGLPRLGGASTGRGWSSFATFQKCPYAWKKRYIEKKEPAVFVEAPALAVGSLVHTFLAIYYAHMMDGSPYKSITNEEIRHHLLAGCNPEFVNEGWRLFQAYERFYKFEIIQPLAVEHNVRDPRTNESCRYDLLAFFPDEAPNRLPGTYIVESKTAGRFDSATLDGWPNDGEILGEVALYKHLKLEKRFGPLQGIIVNIIGKQKDPQFHRSIIAPSSWQIEEHLKDLKRWEGRIRLAIATDVFERARHSCVGRYGMCQWFDHCADPGQQ